MLQSEYNDFADIEETMQTALNDKKIRMQCEARERYERDKLSAYSAGEKAGHELGYNEAREEGIKNLIEVSKEYNASKEDIVMKLLKKYNMSEKEAYKKIEAYW